MTAPEQSPPTRRREIKVPESAAIETAGRMISDFLMQGTDGRRVAHQRALDILDFVMNPQGKAALAYVLAEQGHSLPLGAALKILHRIARNSLDDGYAGARRARIVRGERSSGLVMQIGGRLPGTTKKWQIGYVYDDPDDPLNR